MTTGTDLVKSALRKIGAHSIAAPAAPETITEGRDTLNAMLQSWLSRNINLGIVPLDAVGEEVGEPADATNAIVFNLAMLLAPDFDNGKEVVSNSLAMNARKEFQIISTLYNTTTIEAKVVSSTLPKGQGNKQSFGNFPIFYQVGETIDG